MALFGSSWIWILALSLGAILLTIILCIVIYLCRRRCVKRRIREALEIQENYLAPSMPSNTPMTSHIPSSSNQADDIVPVPPVVNMKSLTMLNIAEESDDDEDRIKESSQNNGTHAKNQTKSKNKHRILDLSSDVTAQQYIKQEATVETPDDAQLTATNGTNAEPVAAIRAMHVQQTSFVMDSEVDYYTQVQQMDARYRSGTASLQSPQKTATSNTDIIDDDDEDIELDYGAGTN